MIYCCRAGHIHRSQIGATNCGYCSRHLRAIIEHTGDCHTPVRLGCTFQQDAILSGRGLPVGARFRIRPYAVNNRSVASTVTSTISYIDCPHFCFEAVSGWLWSVAGLKLVVKRAARKHGLYLESWRDNELTRLPPMPPTVLTAANSL
jgi:hypothetical protein